MSKEKLATLFRVPGYLSNATTNVQKHFYAISTKETWFLMSVLTHVENNL